MACILSKKTSTTLMWVFTVIVMIGLVMTVLNLCGKCVCSRFDGVVMTVMGIFGSVMTAMFTNKPIHRIFCCI